MWTEPRRGVTGFVLAVWLLLIVAGSAHHEVWRDEQRALSLAMEPATLFQLGGVLHEGHPMLWYLLLRAGHLVVGSTLVLKLLALSVASMAGTLWMVRATAPYFLRLAFLFGPLLYEYSIPSRNYGVSVLLLFVFADLSRQGVGVLPRALLLVALAQTNSVAMVLTPLLMAVVWWEPDRPRTEVAGASVLVAVGCAWSYWTAKPLQPMLFGGYDLSGADLLQVGLWQLVHPSRGFDSLFFPFSSGVAADLLMLVSLFGLVRRPPAAMALWVGGVGLGVVFVGLYPGALRHQALWLAFALTLYWMVPDGDPGVPRSVSERVGLAALGAICGLQMLLNGALYIEDLRGDYSCSRALSDVLRDEPALAGALVVSEPGERVEGVRYYVDNPILQVRRNEVRAIQWMSADLQRELSLSAFLDRAVVEGRKLGVPVVVVLDPVVVETPPNGVIEMFKGQLTFLVDPSGLDQLERHWEPILRCEAELTNESFAAYRVRAGWTP